VGDVGEERIPWEHPAELGLPRAFLRTLVLSVREPKRFYALVAREASPWPAILYGLVFEVVVALATFLYEQTLGAAELGSALASVGPQLEAALPGATSILATLHHAGSFFSLLVAPVGYLVELLSTAALTWVGLRLTKNLRTSFATLVRVFAYASWVSLFGLIGLSGDLLLSGVSMLLTLGLGAYTWVAAVEGSQGIGTEPAVRSSLVGCAVVLGVGLLVCAPPLILLVVWAAAKIHLPALPK
jgi:hypothetical protein